MFNLTKQTNKQN
jgi:hypothetical protein